MFGKRRILAFRTGALALAATALVNVGPTASAEEAYMKDWTASLYGATTDEIITYTPLPKGSASKKWHICVAFPHMKDSYYVAKGYGIYAEAKRQGIEATILDAGGYPNLTQQVQQIEDCITNGGDAAVIMAVSDTGLVGLIQELDSRGIPVISMGNPINSDRIKAGIAAEYQYAGGAAGRFLAEQHPKGSGSVKMVWLAGPAGSSWSEDAARGMKEAIAGSDIELLQVMYGDTGKSVQMQLIDDALQTYPDVDIIAGVAPAIEGAIEIVRTKGLENIELVSFYTTPATKQALDDGRISATVTDDSIIASRINMDQALRVLEGKPVMTNARSVLFAVDSENMKSFDWQRMLAPEDFTPQFNIQ